MKLLSGVLDLRLGSGHAGDGHAVGAAGDVVEADAVAELDAARLAAVLAADAEAVSYTHLDVYKRQLCDNAIKYNRPGGHVRVTVGRQDEAPFIRVEDNGIGIAPEHLDRVFERFYRVDKSRSKETGGTGLGLSIVKHAAAWHHASLEAESVPDKGTRITIIFDGKGGE